MPKKEKNTTEKVKEAIYIAAVLGICSAAVKTYLDVQELKVRFDYVYGRWTVPESKKD